MAKYHFTVLIMYLFSHLWSQSSKEIVEIHDNVDEGIGQAAERAVSTTKEPQTCSKFVSELLSNMFFYVVFTYALYIS
jgi:hypothetical protein